MTDYTKTYIAVISMLMLGIIIGKISMIYPPPDPPPVVELEVKKPTASNEMQFMVTDRRTKMMKIVQQVSDLPDKSQCIGSYSDKHGLVLSCEKSRR